MTGVAKTGHADSGTEWQLTARKETKTIQKAQLPRTAHFKVLLYPRIHMQWGKCFPHIPLIFPDHLISSQHICHETQNIRKLERILVIMEFNALILWTPGIRPWYDDSVNAHHPPGRWQSREQHPRLFLLPGSDMFMCLRYSLCPLREQRKQNETQNTSLV